MKNPKVVLICRRSAGEEPPIRGATSNRVCSKCGSLVMVAPSGEAVLTNSTQPVTLVCDQCIKITPEMIEQFRQIMGEDVRRELMTYYASRDRN